MTRPPTFDGIFSVMAAASVGDLSARVALPDEALLDDIPTKFAIALNLLLDDLAYRHAEMKSLEASYLEVFNKVRDAIWIHDLESGRLLDVNERACEMAGCGKDELINSDPGLFMANEPPYTPREAFEWIGKAAREGPQIFEWKARNKAGMISWVEVNLSKAVIGGKNRILALVRDIAMRKEAEEKLKNYTARLELSNRDLQDFVFVASHDLQEPLRKIQSFGGFLQEEYSPLLDAAGQAYIERMRSSALRMQTLIEHLLVLARVTTMGKPFGPVDLSLLLREVLADLEPQILEAGAAVDLGPLPTVDADAVQMRQLFQNICSNALKYRRAGAEPRIRIWCEGPGVDDGLGGRCRINVEDNGIGFKDQYHDKIFKAFERLHSNEEYEGTGIGLAIARKVVERHGGEISAQGFPGKGSLFIITLPMRQKR